VTALLAVLAAVLAGMAQGTAPAATARGPSDGGCLAAWNTGAPAAVRAALVRDGFRDVSFGPYVEQAADVGVGAGDARTGCSFLSRHDGRYRSIQAAWQDGTYAWAAEPIEGAWRGEQEERFVRGAVLQADGTLVELAPRDREPVDCIGGWNAGAPQPPRERIRRGGHDWAAVATWSRGASSGCTFRLYAGAARPFLLSAEWSGSALAFGASPGHPRARAAAAVLGDATLLRTARPPGAFDRTLPAELVARRRHHRLEADGAACTLWFHVPAGVRPRIDLRYPATRSRVLYRPATGGERTLARRSGRHRTIPLRLPPGQGALRVEVRGPGYAVTYAGCVTVGRG
jgi:hypothetical protein